MKSEKASTYYMTLGKSFGLSELHFPIEKMKSISTLLSVSGLRVVSDDMALESITYIYKLPSAFTN